MSDKARAAYHPDDPPPPPPPLPPRPPWVAEVERAGLWAWSVAFVSGALQYGPDGGTFLWLGSRERVTRRAQRMLERLNAPPDPSDRFTVR